MEKIVPIVGLFAAILLAFTLVVNGYYRDEIPNSGDCAIASDTRKVKYCDNFPLYLRDFIFNNEVPFGS